MQHVVRNVTTGLRASLASLDAWMLVAAAIAVPLLATLQYRWLSDLAAAQRAELRQSWAEAVARSATAVNRDLSTFYAAVVESGQAHVDAAGINGALEAWRESATTLGPLARTYLRQRATGRWVAVAGTPESAALEASDIVENSIANVAFGASWLAPTRAQSLPAIAISLETDSEFDTVLLTYDRGACDELLRVLAERYFVSASEARLSIVEAAPRRRALCGDGRLEARNGYAARGTVFRLQPTTSQAPRAASGQGSVGVVMSQGTERVTWELDAGQGADALAITIRRMQTRNLWIAAGLELTLAAAIVIIAVGARRARRTADEHLKFSAVVAHELRTPLAAIKVLAQNQARGLVRRDEQVVEYGQTIAGEADRLHVFVERVLQFAARSSSKTAKLEPVDFERVLSSALHPLRQRIATSGVAVQSRVEPAARMTFGEESGLVLAVRNLVQNALDHAERARTIRVDVRAREREVVISVTDDGAGIPEAERARLFEPLVRGRRTRERAVPGYGLGLAIVRDVARAHGGHARYEPGSPGSVFMFTMSLHATATHIEG